MSGSSFFRPRGLFRRLFVPFFGFARKRKIPKPQLLVFPLGTFCEPRFRFFRPTPLGEKPWESHDLRGLYSITICEALLNHDLRGLCSITICGALLYE